MFISQMLAWDRSFCLINTVFLLVKGNIKISCKYVIYLRKLMPLHAKVIGNSIYE